MGIQRVTGQDWHKGFKIMAFIPNGDMIENLSTYFNRRDEVVGAVLNSGEGVDLIDLIGHTLIIATPLIDLNTLGNSVTISIPAGFKFYIDQIATVAVLANGGAGLVSFGNSGDASKLSVGTAVSATANSRVRATPLTDDGEQDLVVTVSATENVTARAYFTGMLLEDE